MSTGVLCLNVYHFARHATLHQPSCWPAGQPRTKADEWIEGILEKSHIFLFRAIVPKYLPPDDLWLSIPQPDRPGEYTSRRFMKSAAAFSGLYQ